MKSSAIHIPALLISILFFFSALFLLGISALMGITALLAFSRGNAVEVQQTIIFATFGFEAVLLFMATFFLIQKTLRKPAADQGTFLSFSPLQIFILTIAGGGAILLGNWIGQNQATDWLVLPVLTIPAVVLPLAALFALGTRHISLGTRWQSWSVLGLGMSLVPVILLILEGLIAVVLFVGLMAFLTTQPEWAQKLQELARQLMTLGPQSQQARDLLAPWLTKPGVIAGILIYIAVIVPSVEELFKPLGVWLLAGKLDSPSQGFALGALSGASYALIETIGVSAQGQEWASLLFTRIGTGLLHITTSALVGAAIVFAWRQRRYLRLLGTYVLAITLHGLWNAAAMLFTFSEMGQTNTLMALQPFTIILLSVLTVIMFVILLYMNQQMRKTTLPPSSETLVDQPLP